MFTPQQLEQISFSKVPFGGYDKDAVDEFLEPLLDDYVTLYKENALLKSKMRVLVGKLEEYRANEASMKDAIVDAQKTCDTMVKDAEAKCAQMLNDANLAAAEKSRNNDALIAAETERVEEARRAAAEKILSLESELKACLDILAKIREDHKPAEVASEDEAPVQAPEQDTADEISDNLEALVGSVNERSPKAPPKHPNSDTSGKFKDLQFGRNYDVHKK